MLNESIWVAHRGYQKHYPENSRSGISAALALGAQWVEIDVQLTADLVPVICHDHHSLRVGGSCDILKNSWQHVSHCANHEPERFADHFVGETIPALTELPALFANYPSAQCFIELKIQSIQAFGAATCLDAIKQALGEFLPRCVLISFDIATLVEAYANGFTRTAHVLCNWEHLEQSVRLLPQAEYIFCNYQKLPNEHIVSPIPVALYEVHEDLNLARTLLARGATLIETFAIGEMLQASHNA